MIPDPVFGDNLSILVMAGPLHRFGGTAVAMLHAPPLPSARRLSHLPHPACRDGSMPEFRKLLVANRGEIAIRVFRSAHELGIRTVAIYSHEDRFAMHRLKADEAYQVGKPGEPIRSYLNIDGDRRAGQGEGGRRDPPRLRLPVRERRVRPGLRRRRASRSSARGPSCSTCSATRSPRASSPREAGVPVLSGSDEPVDARRRAPRPLAEALGYPVIVKASMGGGGRGMRVVESADALDAALDQARREAGRPPSACPTSSSRSSSAGPSTSRSSSWATGTATSSTSSSATARSSGGTRRSSRSPRRYNLDPALRDGHLRRRRRDRPARPATRTPGPSSSWSTSTRARSTSSRSTRGSRSSTPSPRSSPASTWSRARS